MRKDTIIEVALQLFSEKGYEQTTIAEIMKKTNLSKGGMYHYFSSKEEILESAVKKALMEELDEFKQAIKEYDTLSSKFALLFAPALSTSTYVKNFATFTKNQKKSLVYYKIREIANEFWSDLLKELLLEGLENNIFSFDRQFIDQMSRLVYLYGDDMIYRASMVENKSFFLQQEFTAFIYSLSRLLQPKDSFLLDFEKETFSIINTN